MVQEFFGLDIGSATLKIVQLKPLGDNKFTFVSAKMEDTPQGTPLSESESDIEALAKAIKSLQKDSRVSTSNVVTAFPESAIFTRVIEMPPMADKELSTAIKWEAEQYVPMPLSEVKIDWLVLSRPSPGTEGKMNVFLVAAPLSLIDKYLKIMKLADLRPLGFETEIVAIARSLVEYSPNPTTTLVVSIGAQTSDLFIVDKGIITFTRSIATGGAALARAIAQELGFELSQAEEYKKSYGLMEDQLGGKILDVIKPVFDVIINEIERAILFFQTNHPMESVKRVVLCGGTAKLPGLVVYLAKTLNIEVQAGSPWSNVSFPNEKIAGEVEKEAPSYAVAVGLAMKNIQ